MTRFSPIAIVGRACVLPGAHSPAALWQLVSEQRSALSEAPRGRFRVDARDVLGAPGAAVDRTVSTRGGYVQGFSLDDAGLSIAKADLQSLDPLFSWLCHAGRDALVEAKIDTHRARTGAVVGNLSFPTEAMAAWGERETLTGLMGLARASLPRPFDTDIDPKNRFMSGFPAQLMARALSLSAGAYALDAACASSLYALDLAARALCDGRADVMLAGAVNRADALFLHVGFTALSALSPTGQSRPFDRRADGLVPAEGCALVALMRLEDALAQHKRIYGVLSGIGLSNDGRSRNLLAPSSEGQARALRHAWANAGIDARTLDYVECHATGTPMGDKTEVATLTEALPARDTVVGGGRGGALPLSSLKGNLGHLITAAGAAGLLKVLSAFEHEALPPSCGCDEPIDVVAGGGPLMVQRELAPWRVVADRPRRAGISAFGFGGNNAHAVVEEHGTARVQVAVPAARSVRTASLAVIAIGVRAGDVRSLSDLARRAADQERVRDVDTLDVALDGLRFPPNDLKDSIAQQLLFLEAARDAVRGLSADVLPRERTGVVVGMGTDVKVTTPGVRWRAGALARGLAGDAPPALWSLALADAQDAAMAPLSASHVLGCMPNVVANRVSVQLDLRGPAFVVCAEEESGLAALDVARGLIDDDVLDACLVGAVDACRDPRAQNALEALLGRPIDAGDAALCVVVMSSGRADQLGLSALASLTFDAGTGTPELMDARARAAHIVGDVHAAAGLASLVHAAALVASGTHPGGAPWPDRDRALVAEGVEVTARGAPAVTSTPVVAAFVAAPTRAALIERLRFGPLDVEEAALPWRAYVRAPRASELAARAATLASLLEREPRVDEPGMSAGERALDVGDVCLLFGTAAQPPPWPSRGLLRAFPEAGFTMSQSIGADRLRALLAFDHEAPGALGDLLVASAQMQIHAGFVRDVLGVRAGHALGVSLGESNALFAVGAWADLAGMLDNMTSSGLFSRELGGEYRAVRSHWRALGDAALADGTPWKAVVARAPVVAVRRALEDPKLAARVFLLVIHTPDEVELGGAPDAVDELVARLGASAAHMPLMPAVHCPPVAPAADAYRRVHLHTVTPVPTTVWSHGPMGPLTLDGPDASDRVALAVTQQASRTVDVPTLLQRAVAGGVKAFVDLSPRGLLGAWARRTLGASVPAWSIDVGADEGLCGALDVAGALFSRGLELRTDALARLRAPARHTGGTLTVPMHTLPRPVRVRHHDAAAQSMPPAPVLPRVLHAAPNAAAPRPKRASTGAVHAARVEPAHEEIAPSFFDAPRGAVVDDGNVDSSHDVVAQTLLEVHAAHAGYLALAGALHGQYLAQEEQLARGLAASVAAEPSHGSFTSASTEVTPPSLWSRADLEVLASQRISQVWGATFARQDNFRRQVRMPEPPLLLADRVMSIDAQPGVLEKHRSIQTETDVRWDSWYLHEGRCPAGVLIETGQADLLLVSYMGVDFENRGERVYRLLGCDLTYQAALPLAGAVLAHDIHVDGFANHGDTRIFFFHSDTTDKATGRTLLEVRGGQAGFFSDEELARSGGVLWRAEDVDTSVLAALPLAAPPRPTEKRALTRDEIAAFAAGDVVGCFGRTHARAASHVRTPRIAPDRLQLVDRITHLDFGGGPWKRGYLRAELDLSPSSWFFAGHFKDDPCMPGTLMFEGCLSTLAIYLAAAGFSLERDGFLFEPAIGKTFKLRCRGQAIPSSKKHVYEVFIKCVEDGPEPRIVADILVTVDGLKSLHCEDVELVLRRDWPLSSRPDLLGDVEKASGHDAVGGVSSSEACAFDQRSLLATGIGRPSQAFPGLYDGADGRKRIPRLPGPPYHFMSRVLSVDGPPMGSLLRGESPVGTSALVAYDVPPDAWFFDATARSSGATMPFSVLLELALQPCGWVSSYVGSALTTDEDLCYRNLDGTGTLHREVPRDAGTLLSRATLLKSSSSSGMIIQDLSFSVTLADGTPIYDGTTVFGFFPLSAFERQAGVGSTEAERARLVASNLPAPIDAAAPVAGTRLALPTAPLLMIDRVADVAQGGDGAPTRLRTEKDVDAGEWFFRAHFYEDPVQPGSLGIEAMVQALEQVAMRAGVDAGMRKPRFEALATGTRHRWKYRGQVVPKNARIDVEVEVTSRTADVRGVLLVARGHLWVDGLKIYTCDDLAVRVVDGA